MEPVDTWQTHKEPSHSSRASLGPKPRVQALEGAGAALAWGTPTRVPAAPWATSFTNVRGV